MNKKIMIIFILFIVLIISTILIALIIKTTKVNKILDNISYNGIYSNDNVMSYTSTTNTESQINIIQNEITSNKNDNDERVKVENIKIKVNNNVLNVKLENNASVDSLIEKLKQGEITVNATEYGNFEKVGNLGFSLPTNDTQIRTTVGDVMLYQGNQITLFYASNSWSYTRLGKIVGVSESELKNILGSGDTTLVLSIN